MATAKVAIATANVNVILDDAGRQLMQVPMICIPSPESERGFAFPAIGDKAQAAEAQKHHCPGRWFGNGGRDCGCRSQNASAEVEGV